MGKQVKKSAVVRVAETVDNNRFASLVTAVLMIVVVFFGPQFNQLKDKLSKTENLLRVVNEVLEDNALDSEEVARLQDALKAFNPPAPTE